MSLEPFPPPSRGRAGGLGSGSSSSGADEEPWGTHVSVGKLKTMTLRSLGFEVGRLKSWACNPIASRLGKGLNQRCMVIIGDKSVKQVTSSQQDPFSLAHPLLRRLRSDSSTQMLGPLPTQPVAPEMHIMEAQMEQLRG